MPTASDDGIRGPEGDKVRNLYAVDKDCTLWQSRRRKDITIAYVTDFDTTGETRQPLDMSLSEDNRFGLF